MSTKPYLSHGASTDSLKTSGPPDADLQEVHARVRAAIARERGPVAWLRSLSTPRRLAVVGGAIAFAVGLPRVLVAPSAEASHPQLGSAAVAMLYAIMLFVVVRRALAPAHAAENGQAPWLLGAALVAPFAMCTFAPGGAIGPLSHVGTCFFIGVAVGWSLILLLRALDRGAHEDATVAGLAAGVAGLTASFGLQFDCSESGALHRLLCHATVGVALFLQYALARWLGARFVPARRARS